MDNRDVEKLQLVTFDKSHTVTRKRRPSPAVYESEHRQVDAISYFGTLQTARLWLHVGSLTHINLNLTLILTLTLTLLTLRPYCVKTPVKTLPCIQLKVYQNTLRKSSPCIHSKVYQYTLSTRHTRWGPYKPRTGHTGRTGQCMNHAPAILAAPALIYSTHRLLVVWIIVVHFHLCSLLDRYTALEV